MDRKPIQFRTDQKGLDVDPTNGAIIKGNDGYTPLTFKNQIDPTYILSPTGLVSYAMPGQEHTVIPGSPIVEIPANTLDTFNYSNTNNMNNMQYAQAGGGAAAADQQKQQIIQMVAQGLQQGADPKKIMQELVNMGMPIKQAQQIVMAIAQQIQGSQEEQVAQQQEEEMMQQDQQMGMAEMGGEPCFDCFDHYNPSPQAQNLNWYYKGAGGNTGYMMDDLYQPGRQVKTKSESPNYEPNWFARRTSVPGQVLGAIGNTLPYFGSIMGKGIYDIAFNGGKPTHVPNTDITYDDLSYYMMNRRYLNQDPNSTYDKIIQNLTPEELEQISGPIFKGGGEAFPQAQTYLPYDRPHETTPNFMLELGGESDINKIYQMMKDGGMDYDPKKKKGSRFTGIDEFAKYLNGGSLPKAQYDGELNGNDQRYYDFGAGEEEMMQNMYPRQTNTPEQDAQELQDLQAFDQKQGNTFNDPNAYPPYTADQIVPPSGDEYSGTIPGTLYPWTKKGMRNAKRFERRSERNPEYALTHRPEFGNYSNTTNQPPANNQNPNKPTNNNPNNPNNNNPSNPSNPNTPTQGSSTSYNYNQNNQGNNNTNTQGNTNWMQNAGVDPRAIIAANQAGSLVTQLAGNKAGAALGLLGMVGNAASGFGRLGRDKFKMNLGIPGKRWDVKAYNNSANIAAAGLFGGFGQGNQGQSNQGQGTQSTQGSNVYPQTGPNPNYVPYRMDQEDDPNKWGRIPSSTTNTYPQTGPNPNQVPYRMDQEDDPNKFGTYSTGSPTAGFMPSLTGKKEGGNLNRYMFGNTTGDFKYVTHGPMFSNFGDTLTNSAFVSGINRGMMINKEGEDYAKLQDNSNTISNRLGYKGAAAKTPTVNGTPSPVGTINYMGMNAYSPGNQNFAFNTYASRTLNQGKMGGSILDNYEDGSEVDLSGLTPEEQRAFIQSIMEAGGSVEYI